MTTSGSLHQREVWKTLSDRARELEGVVEGHLVDPDGVVIAAVDIDTLRPHPRELFTPTTDIMRHPAMQAENFGDYFAYENCGMCTGAYLSAMVWKHRATGDSVALGRAKRCFRAIDHIYRLSQQIEPGFFSKYHEGKLSPEMSTDQCMYAMTGLDAYAPVADEPERERIREIIGGIAGMWMRKKYRHPYRERNFDWPWPPNRFPVMLWLAWRHTGNLLFREEFERLAALPEVQASPPHCPGTWRNINQQADAHRAREGNLDAFFWPCSLEGAASAGTALERLLRDEAPFRSLWLQQLGDAIEAGMPKLGGDFLERGHCRYDPSTGKLAEVDHPYYVGGEPNPIWEHKYYIANVKTGHSPPMFARALVASAPYLPDLQAGELALRILHGVDLRAMAWKHDPFGHLPENQKWLTRTLSGDAVTHWLWAYWMGLAAAKPCQSL